MKDVATGLENYLNTEKLYDKLRPVRTAPA